MQLSGANNSETNKEIAKERNYMPALSGSSGLPISTTWARWMLGSIVCLVVPIYRKVLRIEDGVEKSAEAVIEVVENVAEVTEKLAVDLAIALPDNKLKQDVLELEKFAELVDKDAVKAEEFIHKVDSMKKEVEPIVEHIIEEWELIEKEWELIEKEPEENEKENKPSSNS